MAEETRRRTIVIVAGLGLALVAKIIADHGGVIECESQPRRTLFRVLLPVASAETKQNQNEAAHA